MTEKADLLEYWTGRHPFTSREIRAFRSVKRELFVIPELVKHAYDDMPLPTLRGKTISQPTTVMIMTHALDIKPGMTVFEVGSGSGYQAAILSKLVGKNGKVVSSEILPELVSFARSNLSRAGIKNVHVIEADGARGIPDEKFDRIILTAAAQKFPPALVSQLKEEGVIVGPLGTQEEQVVVRAVKKGLHLEGRALGSFLFSPLTGKYGFED